MKKAMAALGIALWLVASAGAEPSLEEADLFARWEHYGKKQGMPEEKTLCVAADGQRTWAGTEKGAVLFEGGEIRKIYGAADGLPEPTAILSIAVDPRTGDVWLGMMSGLARISGGLVTDVFTQLNSGLANNVVYALALDGSAVWAATAGGASRYDPVTKSWEIFDINNTLMHEPWTYSITAGGDGAIYIGVWGGGIVVRDPNGVFREYRDPDGELEIDRVRDDGLVHDVTSAVAVSGNIMWAGTYFGLSRYDGRHWKSYSTRDSGIASDFINFQQAVGENLWIATDRGFSRFNSETWHTWRQPREEAAFELVHTGREWEPERPPEVRTNPGRMSNKEYVELARKQPAGNMVYGIDMNGGDVWLATATGVYRGIAKAGATQAEE